MQREQQLLDCKHRQAVKPRQLRQLRATRLPLRRLRQQRQRGVDALVRLVVFVLSLRKGEQLLLICRCCR